MVLSRIQGRNKTYTHADPLPFDNVVMKAVTAPAPQESMKGDLFGYGSFGGYLGGGTTGRSGELSLDKWGAAMAYCTVPDVNRAVDLLCNSIDSLPFKLIYNATDDKKNDETIAESTDPRPRHKLIEAFRDVNNENAQSFMWESMYSLLVFGENFIEPLYSRLSMSCTGLNMLNPLGVQVIVAGGRIMSFMYTLPGGGGTETFQEWELVYDKTKNPFDKFRGLSKVAVTMTKVNILRDIDRFLRDYFQNNAVPDMTVAPKGEDKFSDTDMLRLRDQVRNQLKGAGNQHRVFISPAAAEYNTLDQADLDKQYTVNDPLTRAVYRTFGIPLSMAGDDAGTQYKAGDPVRVGFYQNTIIPAAHDIAKFVTNQIVPLFDDSGCVRLEFDTSEFDQISEDDSLRSTVANANYAGGIWKLDEARTYTKKDAVGGEQGNAFFEAPAAPLPFDNAEPAPSEPIALPASTDPLQNEFVQALTGNKAGSFDESKHPRADDGKFGEGSGSADEDADKPDNANSGNGGKVLREDRTLTGGIRSSNYSLADVPDSELQVVVRKDGYRSVATFSIPKGETGKGYGQKLMLNALDDGPILHKTKDSIGDNFTDSAYQVREALIRKGQARVITDENGVELLEKVDAGKSENVISGKATQVNAEDELRAWERKALKNWKAPFEPLHLKGFVGSFVQELIAESAGDVDGIKAAFTQARDLLADNAKWSDERLNIAYETLRSFKAYSDTREQFIDEMVKVIGAGQADETTRRKFAGEMRAALRRYGLLAFRDGMEEVGYSPESLSQKELKRFRDWQDEQSGYVTNLGAEVFKVGITENEVALRARMWANNSLQAIRLQGVTAGKGTQRLMWRLGEVENHCPDCLVLDGQVHTADEWDAKGIRPGNGRTVCKQGCDCHMELTDADVKGAWL